MGQCLVESIVFYHLKCCFRPLEYDLEFWILNTKRGCVIIIIIIFVFYKNNFNCLKTTTQLFHPLFQIIVSCIKGEIKHNIQ